MRASIVLAVAWTMLAGQAWAINQFACLKVVKSFADQFMNPEQVGTSSPMFTEDVKGRIDVIGDISGRDLATQYVFGSFASAHHNPTIPSLIGKPSAYNVTALAVQHTTVVATIEIQLWYELLQKSFPIEIMGWYRISEGGQIEAFDMTFKHWTWAMETIVPQLLPFMGQALSLTPQSNMTPAQLMQSYLVASVCQVSAMHCTGANAQFPSLEACLTEMSAIPMGDFDRLGDNNLGCRSLIVPVVQNNPALYCPALGPSGGSLCFNRTYSSVSDQSQFPSGWLAPKLITPDNAELVQPVYADSNTTALSGLLELSLSTSDEHSWDPTFYATFTWAYMLLLWLSTKVLIFGYKRMSPVFRDLSHEHQRNVIMYVMTIFYTTVALALELGTVPILQQKYALTQLQVARMSSVVIAGLYIFELLFRFEMRKPLVAHHIFTLLTMSLCVTMIEYTQSTSYIITGFIWLFQATTEQPTFFGLYGYRMKWNPRRCGMLLKFAAIQTLVFKCASAIGVMVWWGLHQSEQYRPINTIWTVLMWILALGLVCTQVWGTYVTYIIGVKIEKKARQQERDAESGSASADSKSDFPGVVHLGYHSSEGKHGIDYSAPPSTVTSKINLALDVNMSPTSPYSAASSTGKGRSFANWSPATPASPYPGHRSGLQTPISPSLDMSAATLWLGAATPSASNVSLAQAAIAISTAATSRLSLAEPSPLSPVKERDEREHK